MEAATTLSLDIGVHAACKAFGVSRATYYRHTAPGETPSKRPSSPRALSPQEREDVLDTLHSDRFIDMAPREVYATLLDEGEYLCSIRTMYRILEENQEVRERRNQLSHPTYSKPELLATQPNEVWSWDITKLLGPTKWSYFYLYVILDIFSRYVVGWMVADRESAELAGRLIHETCSKQEISSGQLTLHADRGSSMRSKPVALLLSDLGVTKTHSRPYTSDDNPFSESQFKTLKYRPDFPQRFGCLEDARQFCRSFFSWYNEEHRHSGINLLTPEAVHHGLSGQILQARDQVLSAAYEEHPERFVKGVPSVKHLPGAVWINPPKDGPCPEESSGETQRIRQPRSEAPIAERSGCRSGQQCY